MSDREAWLARTVLELTGGQAGDLDERGYVSRLAVRLAELLHPAETLVAFCARAGSAPVAAGSDARAAGLVVLAADGGTSPAADCCRTGRSVRHRPLNVTVTPWPQFASAALAAGFGSAAALPMRHEDETVGAVTVLVPRGQELDAGNLRMTELLAEVAAAGVLQQRALTQSLRATRQLQHALDSRVIIEQAKGAAAAWLNINPAEAFELLRGYARRHGRLLSEVCGELMRGGIAVQELADTDRPVGRGAVGGKAGR